MAPAQANASSKQRKGSTKRTQDSRTPSPAPSKPMEKTTDPVLQRAEDPQRTRPQFARKSWLQGLLFKVDCLMGGPLLNEKEMTAVYLMAASLLALTALGSYKQLCHMVALLTQT